VVILFHTVGSIPNERIGMNGKNSPDGAGAADTTAALLAGAGAGAGALPPLLPLLLLLLLVVGSGLKGPAADEGGGVKEEMTGMTISYRQIIISITSMTHESNSKRSNEQVEVAGAKEGAGC
jgi:hypothetical protein